MALIEKQKLWQMELDQLYLERETTEPDPEMWRWSPLELWEFERMLLIAKSVLAGIDGLKFLEAGCGIGTKLYLASMYYCLDAVGYDISHDYLEKAALLHVDARYMDFREEHPPYHEYDIVYIARPFKTDEMEAAYENAVRDGMSPGSVLISAYTSVKPYTWPCYYRAPFRGVWQKPFDQAVPVYDAMISRQPGYDPLVPTPVGYPG